MDFKRLTAMGALSFLILLVTTSCSRTDLAIKYADQFLAWELKDQFDVSGANRKKLNQLSTEVAEALKKELLPTVIEKMKATKTSFLQRDWNKESIESSTQWLENQRHEFSSLGSQAFQVLRKFTPQFVRLMDEKNWLAFVENFEEKNKEIKKKDTPSRFPNLVEDFLGTLKPEQEKHLKEAGEKLKFDPLLRVKNREHTLSRFQKELQPYSQEAFLRTLNEFFTDPKKWGDSEVQIAQEERLKKQMQTLAQVLKLMTDRQKKHLIHEWNDLIRDLERSTK